MLSRNNELKFASACLRYMGACTMMPQISTLFFFPRPAIVVDDVIGFIYISQLFYFLFSATIGLFDGFSDRHTVLTWSYRFSSCVGVGF